MKPRLTSIICAALPAAFLFFCVPVSAQTPEEQILPLDKVFTTAYQREYMDTLRREFLRRQQRGGFDIDQNLPPMVEESEEVVQAPVLFHLGGIMTRNDGSRLVWLNGVRTEESELPDNMSLSGDSDNPALRVTDEGQSYLLRPGQTLNLDNGSLQEAYELPQAQ